MTTVCELVLQERIENEENVSPDMPKTTPSQPTTMKWFPTPCNSHTATTYITIKLRNFCWEFPFHHFTRRFKRHLRTVLFRRKLLAKHEKEDSENELHGRNLFGIKGRPALYANRPHI